MTQHTLPARHEVPSEQTWDIEALYPSVDAWEAALQAFQNSLGDLAAVQGRLGDRSELLRFLAALEDAELTMARLYSYASMGASVDGRDAEAAARAARAGSVGAAFAQATAFFGPELLELGALPDWMESDDFAPYRIRLQRLLRRREHLRSPEVEALLGALQSPFASARSVHPTLANMDLRFGAVNTPEGEVEVTQGNVGSLTSHPERAVRQAAWEAYADAHLELKHAQAAAYQTGVRQSVFLAEARGYPDAVTAALSPDRIPVEVVSTLLDTYREHTPVWHRLWEVRRRWLGLKEMREFDVKAALTPPRKVGYAQSVDWIAQGMAPLGDAYVNDMVRGLTEERWVDYAENAGKRQGAYSNGGARVKPYIFMTWNDNMGSHSTLAHEIGHSMHSYLAQQEHGASVPRYTLFHAEVASNFNQAMVRRHLLAQARESGDVALEIEIIEEALSNFHRYFFIMPTLAAFEMDCYARVQGGGALSAPYLTGLTARLLREGYGPGVQMDEERSGILWAQFSTHLYANFYAYQYATGIAASHALLAQFDADESAAERYLAFLRSGGSLDPIDALREAGVDMLTPEPVKAAFATLGGYVDRLEEILAEREKN